MTRSSQLSQSQLFWKRTRDGYIKLREVYKHFLVCKICGQAKQKRKPSYKAQSQLEDICEILQVDLMGPITPKGWNGCRYVLIVTDRYSRFPWVENLHEKREAGLALERFVILIENQTGKTVKRIRFDRGREFGVRDLEFRTKEKGIKVENTIAYSPEMNKIAEQTNSLIAGKARCLLLDAESEINESFWPEAFLTGVYLLNRSSSTFLQFDCPLSVWLRVYNSSQDDYIQDITHLRTFGCRVYVNIPAEKRVKSRKVGPVGG